MSVYERANPLIEGWAIVICLLVLAVVVAHEFQAKEPPKPDYEAQANCIAEYDYHHYNSNMMTNLVKALEKCQP